MADFSIAKECDILLTAEQVWADSQSQTEMYAAEAETVKALVAQQKGRTDILTKLEDPALEDDQVKIVWMDFCTDSEPDDCGDVCDFEGEEPILDSKTYSLTACKELTFSLDENNLLRNKYTFEEASAKGLMNIMRQFDEYLNKQGLLFLSANAGYNKNQDTGTWVPNTMYIPAADYNQDLMVDMVVDAKINKLTNPFLIDSGALYKSFLNAEYNSGNLDGKGDLVKSKLFPAYFDMFGFAASEITDTSFLVTPYAYAFANRHYNPTSPYNFKAQGVDQIRYSIESKNIPGVMYDVFHIKECSGMRAKHTWKVQVRWAYLLNPEGCDDGAGNKVSGILSYTKGEVPTT